MVYRREVYTLLCLHCGLSTDNHRRVRLGSMREQYTPTMYSGFDEHTGNYAILDAQQHVLPNTVPTSCHYSFEVAPGTTNILLHIYSRSSLFLSALCLFRSFYCQPYSLSHSPSGSHSSRTHTPSLHLSHSLIRSQSPPRCLTY